LRERTAYLGLGSNLGDREANMRRALALLDSDAKVTVVGVSSLYGTHPVGVEDQPDFLNAVAELRTGLDPWELLSLCLDIENRLGRKRTIRWGPRVIDIDILLYEGVEIADNKLSVPHPLMLERGFVMIPLAEIVPDLLVGDGLTAAQWALRVDGAGVELFKDRFWAE
jgi:2-amino-4-hydroxy-6-hydroxymethyldihydropteridine diphosphokinase